MSFILNIEPISIKFSSIANLAYYPVDESLSVSDIAIIEEFRAVLDILSGNVPYEHSCRQHPKYSSTLYALVLSLQYLGMKIIVRESNYFEVVMCQHDIFEPSLAYSILAQLFPDYSDVNDVAISSQERDIELNDIDDIDYLFDSPVSVADISSISCNNMRYCQLFFAKDAIKDFDRKLNDYYNNTAPVSNIMAPSKSEFISMFAHLMLRDVNIESSPLKYLFQCEAWILFDELITSHLATPSGCLNHRISIDFQSVIQFGEQDIFYYIVDNYCVVLEGQITSLKYDLLEALTRHVESHHKRSKERIIAYSRSGYHSMPSKSVRKTAEFISLSQKLLYLCQNIKAQTIDFPKYLRIALRLEKEMPIEKICTRSDAVMNFLINGSMDLLRRFCQGDEDCLHEVLSLTDKHFKQYYKKIYATKYESFKKKIITKKYSETVGSSRKIRLATIIEDRVYDPYENEDMLSILSLGQDLFLLKQLMPDIDKKNNITHYDQLIKLCYAGHVSLGHGKPNNIFDDFNQELIKLGWRFNLIDSPKIAFVDSTSDFHENFDYMVNAEKFQPLMRCFSADILQAALNAGYKLKLTDAAWLDVDRLKTQIFQKKYDFIDNIISWFEFDDLKILCMMLELDIKSEIPSRFLKAVEDCNHRLFSALCRWIEYDANLHAGESGYKKSISLHDCQHITETLVAYLCHGKRTLDLAMSLSSSIPCSKLSMLRELIDHNLVDFYACYKINVDGEYFCDYDLTKLLSTLKDYFDPRHVKFYNFVVEYISSHLDKELFDILYMHKMNDSSLLSKCSIFSSQMLYAEINENLSMEQQNTFEGLKAR